jgi:hypothetical protein
MAPGEYDKNCMILNGYRVGLFHQTKCLSCCRRLWRPGVYVNHPGIFLAQLESSWKWVISLWFRDLEAKE